MPHESPMKSHCTTYITTATLLLALSACSSLGTGNVSLASSNEPKIAAPSMAFQGAPLPPGAKVKQDKSFIVGSGENWFGRLTLDIGRDSDTAFRFFTQSYPQNGWTLISSVRTAQSLLVFTKGDRNLTIEISQGPYLMGGLAVLTVSPSLNSAPPMNPASRGGNVSVQPIR